MEIINQYECNRVQSRGASQIGICNGVQKSLEIIGSAPQGHICLERWQLWPIVGGAGNGAAEKDWHWDLKPGMAAIWHLFFGPWFLLGTTRHWAPFWGPHGLGVLLAPCSLGESQDHAALEVLPFCHVDGAGRLNHGYGTPDWAEVERRTVCVYGYSKEL